MFEKLTDDLLELTVAERGFGAGNALPAIGIPLCCSIVLCISRGCSSSSSKNEL